jgi:hypothetical protein
MPPNRAGSMRAFGVALGVVQEQDTAVQLPWCLSEVLRAKRA